MFTYGKGSEASMSKDCKCGCAPMHGFNHVAPLPKFKPLVPGTPAYARALDRLSKLASRSDVGGRPALISWRA